MSNPAAWGGLTEQEIIKREKNRARELRNSGWWKNRISQGKCHYCGKSVLPEELTMDHVVPLSRGGRTTKRNVVPACKDCNNRKKHMEPAEWEKHLKAMQHE
ncbi:MAG: HNH endonuclease [Desulfococcus sp. 4484_241]|nr:MAG: HNH endonuclease [Desulfococcus sp. 4484_241]